MDCLVPSTLTPTYRQRTIIFWTTFYFAIGLLYDSNNTHGSYHEAYLNLRGKARLLERYMGHGVHIKDVWMEGKWDRNKERSELIFEHDLFHNVNFGVSCKCRK